jgi:polysaccharide export outer membrane protein
MKLLALSFVLAASAASAQAQTQQPAPPAGQEQKSPAAPYQPEFVIPKPDGPAAPQQTQAAATGPAGPGYVIGVGDNLQITVVGELELTNKFRVDSDGTITYPYLGRVAAAGAKIGDFQDRIRDMLKKDYIRNPDVRIEIDQYKSRSIFVIGEVRSPGRIVMSGTQMTLLEALAMSGSPTSNASTQIYVVHPSKPLAPGATPPADIDGNRITINRKDLELGKAGLDIGLEDGDIINVPTAQRFYMTGMVRNPGSYVLDPGMTLGQAIALAGGLQDRGSDRRINVKRVINGKPTESGIKLDDKILANDEISVGSRLF